MSGIDDIVEAVFQNDKDGNGLTKDEIAKILGDSEHSADVTEFMKACDKDGDGIVTKVEFKAILETSMK